MTVLRAAALAAIFIGFTGCTKPPSEKDLVDAMTSWIATGDMATQAWLNHTTFDKYTRETLELSARMLEDQSDQLRSVAPAHPASLDSAVESARRGMAGISRLVAANDAPDVPAQLDSLRAAKKIVLDVSDSLEKRQQ